MNLHSQQVSDKVHHACNNILSFKISLKGNFQFVNVPKNEFNQNQIK